MKVDAQLNENLNNSAFNDKDFLFNIYSIKEEFKRHIANIIWGSIRYYTSIITTLLAITTTGIGIAFTFGLREHILIFILIPIINFFVIYTGKEHLMSLSITYHRVKHTCIKLEDKMGLFKQTNFTQVFKDDKYIFTDKYVNRIEKFKKYDKPKDFAEEESKLDIAISSFNRLYTIFSWINAIFVVIILLLSNIILNALLILPIELQIIIYTITFVIIVVIISTIIWDSLKYHFNKIKERIIIRDKKRG